VLEYSVVERLEAVLAFSYVVRYRDVQEVLWIIGYTGASVISADGA
jgi:hypothetical protein